MLKESAVEVLVEGFEHFITQYPVGRLEAVFPYPREFIAPVVHNPVERRLFRLPPAVVWEL
jgi:hypothetical protein